MSLLCMGLFKKLDSTAYEVREVKDGKFFKHLFIRPWPGCGADMRYAHRQAHLVHNHNLTALECDDLRNQAMTLKELCERFA